MFLGKIWKNKKKIWWIDENVDEICKNDEVGKYRKVLN